MVNKTLKIVITGAAGQIAYSLIPKICEGMVFGNDVAIDLRLLDIEMAISSLEGVAMEIQDSAYDLVESVVTTTEVSVAFEGVEVAILLGGYPRKQGMERFQLIERNVQIMRLHGEALEKYADRDCKVIVVANPANTNCLIARKFAPSIPAKNFSALTRLDHERLKGMLAAEISSKRLPDSMVKSKDIKNCFVWGNHSSSQVPDVSHGEVFVDGHWQPISKMGLNSDWVENDLVHLVQQRGAAVIAARKLSSAMSAANAVSWHLRDLFIDQKLGCSRRILSMAVLSDGNPYGIPDGLFFSFPVTCEHREWKFVQEVSIGSEVKPHINKTVEELLVEREMAYSIIASDTRGHL